MRGLALLIVAALVSPCYGQWTATILHPPTAAESLGRGSGPSVQVGEYTDGAKHAALWSGSAASLVDLHPTGIGAGASIAYSAALTQQVGVTTFGFTDHASLWTGSAASYSDLNPISISSSHAYGTDGGNQVGDANVGVSHAAFWAGSAATFADIHPGIADASIARAVAVLDIVGDTVVSGSVHAAFWHDPTHLYTDLHPAGADNSFGTAVIPGTEGGIATFAGTPHAGLWTGSAASFVDLNTPGKSSELLAMDEGVQAGWITTTGVSRHASFWTGSAASVVDLQSYLPLGYHDSEAHGIWTDGSVIQIAGYATHDTETGSHIEAVLWTRSVPEPASSGSLIALLAIQFSRRRK